MSDKYLKYTDSGRIYEEAATDVSTGASEAGRIVALGADGKLDNSLLSLDALYGYSVGPVVVGPGASVIVDTILPGVLGSMEWFVRLESSSGFFRSFKLLCGFDGSVSPPFSVYGVVGSRMDYNIDVTYNTSSGVADLTITNSSITDSLTVTLRRAATR